ncbi:MAG: PD40 domain-containing protein [Crocinitomicaceae bacterium]|nr:PD40 domain-containing protein [Crocinitomicaceae bacterium]
MKAELEKLSFNDQFEVANSLMFDKVYSEALFVWEFILEDHPTNANILYKIGMCYVYLNQESKALPYFEKAQYSVVKNYNPISPMEKNAPPELYYYLAKSSHINGKIDTAYYQYEFFLKNVKKRHEKYDLGQLGLAQCKVAKQLMADPQPYIIRNIGSTVNTEYPEYSPVITIDGSALFFTSKRLRPDSTNLKYKSITSGQHYEDIYVSYRNADGSWSSPKYLGFCDPRKNNASISVAPDGQTVFVYVDINNGDIYYSEIQDTVFKSIVPFPAEELNSKDWETHATISPDGKYLYFVSDREGGMGGRDIYRLKILPDGSWSKAFNLGPPINTEYDEDAPFLGADSKTMYFSSNGPGSMGGFDIFISQMDESETWSEPVNMGYPLNSYDDDIFYTTTADGRTGFYSSDKIDGQGDKDIYIVQTEDSYIKNVAIFSGFILTADHSRIPKGITIHVTDLTDATPTRIYRPRRRDGGYVLNLKPCHTYQVDYKLDGEDFYNTELYVPCNSSYQEIRHELLLDMVNLEASELSNMPIDEQRWEFENNEYLEELEGYKISTFEDDSLLYEDFINKYGQFPYKNLDPTKSHLFRIEEADFEFCEDLVLNLVDTANNVLDTYTFQSTCETGETVQEFSSILTTPIFQYNFGYNKEKFNTKNEALNIYVDGIKQLIDADKNITIIITASASKVPTRAYANNYDLAEKRLETGKKTLIRVLKSEGIDVSKINFVEEEPLVQGPDYNNDAREKQNVYQRYQYIKFEIQF